MRRLQLPRLTSSSFAASTSMCQLDRNGVRAFNSRNDRWMNAHRSCRRTSAYILAGEGVIILLLKLFWIALFHTVIGRPDDFDVGSTERKLGRLNAGGTGFDFINPVEEPTYRRLIAASGFGSELHCCRL